MLIFFGIETLEELADVIAEELPRQQTARRELELVDRARERLRRITDPLIDETPVGERDA